MSQPAEKPREDCDADENDEIRKAAEDMAETTGSSSIQRIEQGYRALIEMTESEED